MNQLDFSGRSAVITGGAAGIGLAIAQRLIASGGRVSVWDRDAAALVIGLHRAHGSLFQKGERQAFLERWHRVRGRPFRISG